MKLFALVLNFASAILLGYFFVVNKENFDNFFQVLGVAFVALTIVFTICYLFSSKCCKK